MPRVPIDDLDDPRIAVFRRLKAAHEWKFRSLFVVEGETLFDRLRQSRYPLHSVLVADRHEPRFAERVPAAVPLYVVPHEQMSALVGFEFHRGIIACGERRPWPSLAELAPPRPQPSTVLVCPRLDNPDNLGTIVRNADAFGVDLVVLGPRAPDPLSRRVVRVSMGSALRLPVIPSEDLAGDLDRLASELGYELAAAVLDRAALPLEAFARPARLALLWGREADGLDADSLARCTHRLTIPIHPRTDSLNVGVASGILLYRLMPPPGG